MLVYLRDTIFKPLINLIYAICVTLSLNRFHENSIFFLSFFLFCVDDGRSRFHCNSLRIKILKKPVARVRFEEGSVSNFNCARCEKFSARKTNARICQPIIVLTLSGIKKEEK